MNDSLYSKSVPESIKQIQVEFASHIRNPEKYHAPAGIEARRMKVYTELFYSSISSLLAGTFPIIRELYDDTQWQSLVRAFYQKENNHTPHFPEISREFVAFLKHYDLSEQPFLAELAHYEWVELAVDIDKREFKKQEGLTADDFKNKIIVNSKLARLNVYQYPVHQISIQFQPKQKLEQTLYILVYRNSDDDVKFIELNPMSAVLFEKLQTNSKQTGSELLQQFAEEAQQQNPKFLEFGIQIIEDWYQKDLIQGIK